MVKHGFASFQLDGDRPFFLSSNLKRENGHLSVALTNHDKVEDGRVVGLLTDTTGVAVELDRTLPDGIVLQNMRDLAFALLDAEQLVGRSVEFTTFDPQTGGIDTERYDVLRNEVVELDGEEYNVLRVNLATGLENEIYLVRSELPRIPLSRISSDGAEVENVTFLEMGPPREVGPTGP